MPSAGPDDGVRPREGAPSPSAHRERAVPTPLPSCRPLLALLASTAMALHPADDVPPPWADDPIRALQEEYIAHKDEKATRAYHFGSQRAGDVFSNHTGHTNRLIPVYTFGRTLDLKAVTGANSRYRGEAQVRALYGRLSENTVNPRAVYADQSDLHRVQEEAIERGTKYVFTVWFDGMDWDTARAAAVAKTGRDYAEGKGSGLAFQDYAGGDPQFGFVVTSPTHDKARPDVDAQSVSFPGDFLFGGYDARIAGPNPWTPGPRYVPGYLKGLNASKAEREAVAAAGGVLHAYTDSSCSAAEYASGVKSYNNGINVAPDGRFVPTLFNRLQADGWKVGTVTSVPFDHASPAAMYAHNVFRDDYQDLAREMLGLPGVVVEATGKGPRLPGLDVVLGTGYGIVAEPAALAKQGRNAVPGPLFLTAADRRAIDAAHGGRYVVAETAAGQDGGRAVRDAARRAAREGRRLFGQFGREGLDHLPYRTADGRFDPVRGQKKADRYTPADLLEQPTLADLTAAALTVLAAEPGRPFALFVEAGDVDFALHDNNLDNAIGAIYSGEAAIRVILDWVERHSNWDESALIVTADHGHFLVLDDPAALAGGGR